MRFDLRHGDSREVLPLLDAASVDALVTDPPAGIGFMGKDWDDYRRSHNAADVGRANVFGRASRVAPEIGRAREGFKAAMQPIFEECLRVLKPGAHGLVWALPRTSHWTATALEDAGFEIRDRVSYLHGTGFPKSLNVSKALDKAAGAEREVLGPSSGGCLGGRLCTHGGNTVLGNTVHAPTTAPATALAREWDGWGTALKPACEDWWLVRKPLSGTVAANVTQHGVGALNIDACRIAVSDADREALAKAGGWSKEGYKSPDAVTDFLRGTIAPGKDRDADYHPAGRWPANVTLDEEAAALLDAQSGDLASGEMPAGTVRRNGAGFTGPMPTHTLRDTYGDSGGASRFFYVAKPGRGERDIGCEDLPAVSGGTATDRNDGSAGTRNPRAGAGRNGGARNIHPTVKSVDLMRWLCRLVTPKGGLVLDPFMGSGSTGIACAREGMRFIGIERERAYFEIARRRIVGDAPLLNRIGQIQLEGPDKDSAA
ncbi:MAG TPA: DNA methyltransferase [Gemmatimonadaceae bacterium]